MTNNNHPITPPDELVQQLCDKAILHAVDGAKKGEIEVWLVQEAFRAGADQELEACRMEIIDGAGLFLIGETSDRVELADKLRAARRPKPPSLKAEALEALKHVEEGWRPVPADCAIIRRALESLPD